MIKAIIVDDELPARENLRLLIAENCENVHVIAEARNVPEAEEVILKHHPDLVFLDVDMPKFSGFDLIDRLKTKIPNVIFTTGHEKYAHKAFKVAAVDYLVKPVDTIELLNAIKKVSDKSNLVDVASLRSLLGQIQSGRISISSAEEIHMVEPSSIAYVEADRNCSIFHLDGARKIMATKPLSDFEKVLEPHRFLRVHKSFLVNLDHIEVYKKGRGGQLILRSGQIVDVARNKKDTLMRELGYS
ncbi:MAG: hypothetical protein CMB80_18165 [Flammeovirgaceae bacterium]|nr:hypothetical protein [Flammeovirgaceae bacterium]|tara:strand:- start:4034 stop:4765 length:732 start_codon:yes stop_codon:yes gene_type:complete